MLKLDPDDKAEIRQMLLDVLAASNEKMEGKFNLIQLDLQHIKNQTVENDSKIKALQTAEDSRKAVYKFIAVTATVVSGISVIIIAFLELIKG